MGSGKVVLSFGSWKDEPIGSTTHVLNVVKPNFGVKQEPVTERLVRSLVHPARSAVVRTVRYNADGSKLFAAGYPSGVVQVWDANHWKELRRVETPPGYRGSADYAWPTPDFATLFVPKDHRKPVRYEEKGERRVRFEHSGETLAWNLATGEKLPSIPTIKPDRGVIMVYLSPSGGHLVVVERPSYSLDKPADDEVVLWDLKTRSSKSLGFGYGMAGFSKDGKQLVLSLFGTDERAGSLIAFDLGTGKERFRIPAPAKQRGFSWPVVSDDAKMVFVQDGAGRIDQPATMRFFAMETGKELASFPSKGKSPFMPATFSPDSRFASALDYEQTLHVWDLQAKKSVRTFQFKEMSTGMWAKFSPDGRWLATVATPKSKGREVDDENDPDPADFPQPRLALFDLARNEEPTFHVLPSGFLGDFAFHPDGRTLAVGSSGAVQLIRMP